MEAEYKQKSDTNQFIEYEYIINESKVLALFPKDSNEKIMTMVKQILVDSYINNEQKV